jgi:BirA family biotin operon repressor/biotin-[acetyl-CoA-carboxylase] ligase
MVSAYSSLFSLLRQLSDGAFHSGEDLAASVGLTRARGLAAPQAGRDGGLALERVRGRGYRLLATPDFLEAESLREASARHRRRRVCLATPRRRCSPAANDDDIALPATPSR